MQSPLVPATTGQSCDVVSAFGVFLAVVVPRSRITQCGERDKVESTFELLVAALGEVFTTARGPRGSGRRG